MRIHRPVVAALALAALLTSSSCLVWKNQWRNSNAVKTADDIAYVDDDNDKHRLDVFAPRGAQGAPVVIFIHGGFWRSGDRSTFEPIVGLYGNVGTALADNDVVTVIPSYRLFPEVKSVDDMLDDVARSIAWTRDHIAVHGGDPDKIVLAGHSAGAHLVALLATQPGALEKRGLDPRLIKGVVPLSGIYNVADAARRALEEDRAELYTPLFGGREQEQSPARYFDRKTRPAGQKMPRTLFVVGENDYESCLADYRQAEKDLAPWVGDEVFFHFVPAITHEEIVLRIGTAEDEVGPAVAAFAHFVTK